jgi:hypothetical protein
MPITHDVLRKLKLAYEACLAINELELATHYWQALVLAKAIGGQS